MRKRVATIACSLGLLSCLAAGFECSSIGAVRRADAGPPNVTAAGAAANKDSKLLVLQRDRIATLREIQLLVEQAYRSGGVSFDRFSLAQIDLLRAELEACRTDPERLGLLEKIAAIHRHREQSLARVAANGGAGKTDVLRAKSERLLVEIEIERIRDKSTP